MSYTAHGPPELFSRGAIRRVSVTNACNAQLQRGLVKATWSYRHLPGRTTASREWKAELPPGTKVIPSTAPFRLHWRFRSLVGRGKPVKIAMVTTLLQFKAFAWAIAQEALTKDTQVS